MNPLNTYQSKRNSLIKQMKDLIHSLENIKKSIDNDQDKNEKDLINSDLDRCIDNIQNRIHLIEDDASFEQLVLSHAGFGLMKGFGEIFYNYKEDWAKKIMHNVIHIEKQYTELQTDAK